MKQGLFDFLFELITYFKLLPSNLFKKDMRSQSHLLYYPYIKFKYHIINYPDHKFFLTTQNFRKLKSQYNCNTHSRTKKLICLSNINCPVIGSFVQYLKYYMNNRKEDA